MLNRTVRFGPFEADLSSGELWRSGAPVPIQDLPFRMLAALLENPGAVITRAELASRLWGADTYIDATAGLNTAAAKLREALGDSAERPAYIETVPKRGYRFIGAVAVEAPVAQGSSPVNDLPAAQGGSPANPPAKPVAQGFGAANPRALWRRSRLFWAGAAGLAVSAGVLLAAFQLRADRPPVRIAVVLFDNETGEAQLDRLAQNLTDATVTELTADARLAVVGNAAVLRTARPFRDIARIRDAVNADYVVIGQVQALDRRTIVRTHLIRAADQSHLVVNVSTLSDAGEASLQEEVSRGVRAAVARALASGAGRR